MMMMMMMMMIIEFLHHHTVVMNIVEWSTACSRMGVERRYNLIKVEQPCNRSPVAFVTIA